MDEKKMPSGVISKAQLIDLYGISRTTLWRLLNVKYYEELAQLGYEKNARILSPKQIEKFVDLYGEP